MNWLTLKVIGKTSNDILVCFKANFERILHIYLVILLLTLEMIEKLEHFALYHWEWSTNGSKMIEKTLPFFTEEEH